MKDSSRIACILLILLGIISFTNREIFINSTCYAGEVSWAWEQDAYEHDGSVTLENEDYSINPSMTRDLTRKSIRQTPTVIVQATTSNEQWYSKCYVIGRSSVAFWANTASNSGEIDNRSSIIACGDLDGTSFSGIVGDLTGIMSFFTGGGLGAIGLSLTQYQRTDGKLAQPYSGGCGYSFSCNSGRYLLFYKGFDISGTTFLPLMP